LAPGDIVLPPSSQKFGEIVEGNLLLEELARLITQTDLMRQYFKSIRKMDRKIWAPAKFCRFKFWMTNK
jgi:hypothetical protein